jgi:hypothetical protein
MWADGKAQSDHSARVVADELQGARIPTAAWKGHVQKTRVREYARCGKRQNCADCRNAFR